MDRAGRASDDWPLFSQGFRPFFLATALWAVIAMAIWTWTLIDGAAFPSRFDPLSWHIHEMLFGFAMAAVGGFLLTAIPNWTGRLPIRGAPLATLALLWLAGRLACLISGLMPEWAAALLDLAFPAGLIVAAWREIVAGKNWRNLIVLLPVTILGAGSLMMHLVVMGMAIPADLPWRLALASLALLLAVIGGRITPSFTRNWLVKRGQSHLPAPQGRVDHLALGSMALALFGWAFFPGAALLGLIGLVAAAVNFWRLARWRGFLTWQEPLLLILHIGYGWLAISVGLIGLSMLTKTVPEAAAVHALTVGAMSVTILAVMARATRGHTGRDLSADRATKLIFVLINAAAVLRVAAEFFPAAALWLLGLVALLWGAAFLGFLTAYAPMLLRPRPARA